MKENEIKICIIGLGYVGLPVAVAFSKKYSETIGFDLSASRIDTLKSGVDKNGDIPDEELQNCPLAFTMNEEELKKSNFFVVAVPTPIDSDRRPDLTPLLSASEIVGRVISKGATIVFESTVYPGVTEEYCGPIIEKISGLKQGVDFKLGYSPERINPGDRTHTLEKIIKVVSGEDRETGELIAKVYSKIIEAGIHLSPSIKVAEAAKIIENTQRDLNIALMNELAIIFDKMNIPTTEVLKAAGTKWNFLPFSPGLVGGHCIGVDPYYLTAKAEQLGYQPRVILAGRAINDSMGQFIANKAIKLLIRRGINVKTAKIAVLGLTFKENVSDLRNSRVPDIIEELRDFEIDPVVSDPCADAKEALREYNLELVEFSTIKNPDVIILAVSHQQYQDLGVKELSKVFGVDGGVLLDIKGIFASEQVPSNIEYWSL